MIYDKRTGFPTGNPHKNIAGDLPPIRDAEKELLADFILSASGWRAVFSSDGDPESFCETISPQKELCVAVMAAEFISFIRKETGKQNLSLAIGCDSRPTGQAIATSVLRVMKAENIATDYLFITPAPEIMSYTKTQPSLDGFFYISASHNPIGYNGIKLGLSDGKVLDGKRNSLLVEAIKNNLNKKRYTELLSSINALPSETLSSALTPVNKIKAENSYREFAAVTAAGALPWDVLKSKLTSELKKSPLGIVQELNGSARTLTIDRDLLKDLGCRVETVNGTPRQITHPIVPEGDSLNLCKETLERLWREDKSFQLGYVPDNDGDRGNIVCMDNSGKAFILQAQEVFALCVLSELSYLEYSGNRKEKSAIVVNGPTSLRIEAIAGVFDVKVFYTEVGEANVVGKAESLRDEGWQVQILGEGSNGGNITWPSTVRDPLNTLLALIKLLKLRGSEGEPGLFKLWCKKSGRESLYKSEFTLPDIVSTLPRFSTTGANESRAKMQVRKSHKDLKAAYEKNFPLFWKKNSKKLKEEFGISDWEEWNNEGQESRMGIGSDYRSGAHTGGLKILLKNRDGESRGYLWMRGSGTEPLFRILADWSGPEKEKEAWLLEWQKEMVSKADI